MNCALVFARAGNSCLMCAVLGVRGKGNCQRRNEQIILLGITLFLKKKLLPLFLDGSRLLLFVWFFFYPRNSMAGLRFSMCGRSERRGRLSKTAWDWWGSSKTKMVVWRKINF